MTPSFTEINAFQGSKGGTLLTATIAGLGRASSVSELSIVDSTGASIC